MKVKIKFLTPMMKNGRLRKIGETMELDATSALLLAEKGNVTIPGYKIEKVERTIVENILVPENGK